MEKATVGNPICTDIGTYTVLCSLCWSGNMLATQISLETGNASP